MSEAKSASARGVLTGCGQDDRGPYLTVRLASHDDGNTLIEAGAWGAAVLVVFPAPELEPRPAAQRLR